MSIDEMIKEIQLMAIKGNKLLRSVQPKCIELCVITYKMGCKDAWSKLSFAAYTGHKMKFKRACNDAIVSLINHQVEEDN